jgi:hypothetical protein
MRLIFSQIPTFAAAIAALLALAGCNGMSEVGFDTKMTLGSVSMVDRCSDFMSRAFPHSFIDVMNSHIDTDSQNALVTVQGVRGDVPESSAVASRNVAVECHFESGVLTSFRWIAGPFRSAPPPPSAPGPAATSPAAPSPAVPSPAKTNQTH